MKVLVLLLVLVLTQTARGRTTADGAAFGRPMLAEFQMAEGYHNFNYGSFGAVPRQVMQQLRVYEDEMEARPDIWLRSGYRERLVAIRQRLAAYVGATDPNDLVMVENTSSGVNAVLRSIRWQPGDKVLSLSIEYPMVRYLLQFLKEREGIEIVEVPIALPVTGPEAFYEPIRAALDQHPDMRLVIISHISSSPGFVLPAQEIADLCRARGVRILVDGAHVLGQLPLNLAALNVDYYIANGHKWLYSPKGSAFLWVAKRYQEEVAPTVVSSEFGNGDFVTRFQWTGTRDYSAMLAVGEALNFRESIGGDEAIRDYCHNLAWWAGNYLAGTWNTTLLGPESVIGNMIDVGLPVATDKVSELQTRLYDQYGMYIASGIVNSRANVRLSAQVFLEQADFIELSQNVLTIARELGQVPK